LSGTYQNQERLNIRIYAAKFKMIPSPFAESSPSSRAGRMKTHGIFCVESIIYILYFQPFLHRQMQERSRSHPLIHQSAEGHSGMLLGDVPDFLR
jgi:hypothetical protein